MGPTTSQPYSLPQAPFSLLLEDMKKCIPFNLYVVAMMQNFRVLTLYCISNAESWPLITWGKMGAEKFVWCYLETVIALLF